MKRYLAVDIGASSGRHIVGWEEDGRIRTEEVFRFPNGVTEAGGSLTWDIGALLGHVKAGIMAAKARYPDIRSLSVDTWGVDYVLLRGGEAVLPCYAYRDGRTEAVIPLAHEKIAFSELYRRTGIQFQPFNTVYQLYADNLAGRLDGATDFLMIPEYLMYRLCGVKSHEYTNATTGGMVSAETGEYDPAIIGALGLPRHLFHALQRPGRALRHPRHGLRRRRHPHGGGRAVYLLRDLVTAGRQDAEAGHGHGERARQLVERGRCGLQPLPEEHHGHVAAQPAPGRAVPGHALGRDHRRG